MSTFRLSILIISSCMAALAQDLIAVVPAAGNAENTLRLLDPITLETVLAASADQVPPDVFQIIPAPGGSKYFVIARRATPVSVLDAKTGAMRSISGGIPLAASAATLTPDGSRLAVAAGQLYFFDATSEVLKNPGGTALPGTITEMAATYDGRRLLVLSQVSASQSAVTAIDLTDTETVAGTIFLPGASNGIMIAPNGLVYVSGTNRVFELDPRTNQLTKGGDIFLPGTPGKAVASPDGNYLVLPNLTPGTTAASLFQILLANKLPAASASIGNEQFISLAPQRLVTGQQGMFAVTRSGHLYDVRNGSAPSASVSYADAFFTEGGVAHPVYGSVAFSGELYPRKLVVTKSKGDLVALSSVDLIDGRLQSLALSNQPWRLAMITPPAQTGALRMQPYNPAQVVAAGARASKPLVVRLIEPYGRGVFGASVTFSTAALGVTIDSSSALTGSDGYAQTYVSAGDAAGPFVVTASSPGVPDVSFTLTVPSTPNGADLSGLNIVSGNGQVVRELSRTVNPMVAQLLDLNGNPQVNEPVLWVLRDGLGAVLPLAFRTDANGFARANFEGSIVTTSDSYTTAVVEAATAGAKVTFRMVTTPNIIPGRGFAADPTATINYPDFNGALTRTFNGRAGGVIRNAIGITVTSSVGPAAGLGIPNVGLRVTTTPPASAVDAMPPLPGFTASCPGDALTDANGVVNCDLIIGTHVGSGGLYFNAGGFRDLPSGVLNISLGDPAKVLVVVGSNQTAPVRTALGTPLSARVTDAGNNVLNGVTVNWTVTRGTATLSDSTTITDSNGFTVIHAQLGSAPGPVTVRAAVNGQVFANFVLTATVNYGGISLTAGDGQSALVGAPFTSPLAVTVVDDQGQPIPGATVQFSSTYRVVLSAASALTDSAGVARVSATAGSAFGFGPANVFASVAAFSVSFTLRVLPRAPVIDGTSFTNAASFQPGMTPCGLTAITGVSLAPGVAGIVTPAQPQDPPLPYALGPVDGVLIGGFGAPIVSVSNMNGIEQIIVQAPCELAGVNMTQVSVRVRGLDPVFVPGIPVVPLQPGIFETTGADGLKYANPTPVARGSRARLTLTGLGPVTPPVATNVAPAATETINASIVAGLNDAGITVTRVQVQPGMLGTYIVEIEIPANAAVGRASVVVAANTPGGEPVYSQSSYLIIQ